MSEKSKLHNLRTELEIINIEFLELIDKRQEVVNQIQNLKKEFKTPSNWNPEREKSLFAKYADSNKHSLHLDMMYSLLVEKQAYENGRYPLWSKGEHLDTKCDSLESFMNPVLLFIRNKEEYLKLNLKKEIKNIIEELFKDES